MAGDGVEEVSHYAAAPGAGPRGIVFHPDSALSIGYLISVWRLVFVFTLFTLVYLVHFDDSCFCSPSFNLVRPCSPCSLQVQHYS